MTGTLIWMLAGITGDGFTTLYLEAGDILELTKLTVRGRSPVRGSHDLWKSKLKFLSASQSAAQWLPVNVCQNSLNYTCNICEIYCL